MAIEFSPDVRKHLIGSIKQYFAETLDQDIGELKASLLLDFFVQEVGPAIYNAAVSDAQRHILDIVSEIDGTCFEPEPTTWRQ